MAFPLFGGVFMKIILITGFLGAGKTRFIKTLVEKLRKTKVPSLFVESSVDERPMQTVSKDTNIPIFEKIFTDSVAEPGQNGDSYYNMMKWNLDKIAEGLSK